jgi:predicted transcriptional regulator of viral defense system
MKYQEVPKKNRNVQDYQLIAYGIKKSQGKPWAILSTEEIMQTLGLSLAQTTKLFTRLHSQNRIQKIKRGLYIVPGRFPPLGKIWKPSPYEVLCSYMNWLGASWQITGLAAFTRYSFSTQVPQVITVCNDKLSGKMEIGGNSFVFIKIPKKKIGNNNAYTIIGALQIPFSSKARTIFDAVYFSNIFGTLPAAYTWIALIAKNKDDIKELIECCNLYGNKQTIARIGFFLEKMNIDTSLIKIEKEKITETLFPLIPGTRRGPINRHWGIIENESTTKILSVMENPDEDDI